MTDPLQRTSTGLREALFDQIERIRDGKGDIQEARTVATLAHAICNTVKMEIEVAKLRTDYPADTPLAIPSTLQLGDK